MVLNFVSEFEAEESMDKEENEEKKEPMDNLLHLVDNQEVNLEKFTIGKNFTKLPYYNLKKHVLGFFTNLSKIQNIYHIIKVDEIRYMLRTILARQEKQNNTTLKSLLLVVKLISPCQLILINNQNQNKNDFKYYFAKHQNQATFQQFLTQP